MRDRRSSVLPLVLITIAKAPSSAEDAVDVDKDAKIPSSPSAMNNFMASAKYHRHGLRLLLIIFALLCVRTSIRLTSTGNRGNGDNEMTLLNSQDNDEVADNGHLFVDAGDKPRVKRNILEAREEKRKIWPKVSREGPVLDFGTDYPARFGDDVFISVKTTLKYHSSRLADIVDTWFRLAPDNIYFVTDAEDEELQRKTGSHVIVSNCPATHSRQALCCKLAVEYEAYLKSNRSWFCHFDDDNYVNVPQLMRTLSQYDPYKDYYLGKSSTSRPIEILDRENGRNEKVSFWFATGGAGFCLSKSLATKMVPYASNGKFAEIGERIRLPDDVTMGFIIEHLLQRNLRVVEKFHSHLENMKAIPLERLHEQVSLSAGSYSSQSKNVVNLDGYFDLSRDENRFKSLHCFLFANASVCQKLLTPQAR